MDYNCPFSMSFFDKALNLIRGKGYGDVIMPNWDSLDIVQNGQSLRRTETDFLNYNRLTLYLNRAINKRAEKVGQVEWQVTKGESVLEEHPILDVLRRPNKYHTGRQFWRLYQKYLDITGHVFLYKYSQSRNLFDPKSYELHLLRPDCVEIIWSNGEIVGYKYRHAVTGNVTQFEVDEVLYYFNPDPLKPLEGESLLQAGIRQIDTENQLAEYHSNILRNGGKIDGVFKFKQGLTAEQLNTLREDYKRKYAEAKRSGQPMFLGGDAAYERISLNPEELSYLESKKVTLNDICLLTGVPRAMLAQTGDETYANADAAHRIFLRETIKPLIEQLCEFIDWRLADDTIDVGFVDPTPEDIERKVLVLKAASETHAITTNEKREMLGLEPLTGVEGDAIYVPFGLAPLAEERPEPVVTPPADEEQKSYHHPLRDYATRRRYEKLMRARYDRREEMMQRVIKRYFVGQQERIVSHLAEVRTYRRKDLFGETFDRTVELRLAQDTIIPVLRDILAESGQDAMELAGSLQPFVLATDVRSWLDERSATFAKQITDTTFEKLKNEFEESLTENENRQQLIDRIQNTYDGYTEGRARTIARTEVHNATQRGTFAGYKQAGVPIKIWVAVGDLQTRDAHMLADGQERPIDIPFDVAGEKLMYPGDPNGSGGNTINCRCTV